MAIQLNDRLRAAADAAMAGVVLNHPDSARSPAAAGAPAVAVTDHGVRAPRRVVGALLAAAAVAAVVGVIVVQGEPARVSAGDGGQAATSGTPSSAAAPSTPADIGGAVGQRLPEIPGLPGPPDPDPTLVVVVASWCPHCSPPLAQLASLVQSDVPWENGRIVVVVETRDEVGTELVLGAADFASLEGLGIAVIGVTGDDTRATALVDELDITGFPTFVFAGADGVITARQSGETGLSALLDQVNASS